MKREARLLELLAFDLGTSYRFPWAEVLAFIYVLLPCIFGAMGAVTPMPGAAEIVTHVFISMGLVAFLTMLLIVKTASYDVAGQIESGYFRTLLTYPIKRRGIFLTKLVAISTPIALYCVALLLFLFAIRPSYLIDYPTPVGLIAASSTLELALFMMLCFLIALAVKSKGKALLMAIGVFFGLTVLRGLLLILAGILGSRAMQMASLILGPTDAVMLHYGAQMPLWEISVSFEELLAAIAGSTSLVAAVSAIAFLYFVNRFET